jgi:hypothetical protein
VNYSVAEVRVSGGSITKKPKARSEPAERDIVAEAWAKLFMIEQCGVMIAKQLVLKQGAVISPGRRSPVRPT